MCGVWLKGRGGWWCRKACRERASLYKRHAAAAILERGGGAERAGGSRQASMGLQRLPLIIF